MAELDVGRAGSMGVGVQRGSARSSLPRMHHTRSQQHRQALALQVPMPPNTQSPTRTTEVRTAYTFLQTDDFRCGLIVVRFTNRREVILSPPRREGPHVEPHS